MKILKGFVVLGVISLYGFGFALQDERSQNSDITLDFPLPQSFHSIVFGYMKQFVAEMLFIKVSVFMGGVKAGTPPSTYDNALSRNFEVMTSLHPRFIDPYYFCQAFLPHVSVEKARITNNILETGIRAYPSDLILRFFYSSNFFLNMNEPLKGAEAFNDAAQIPGAPPMFGHLAALLSAKGGDLTAGLLSLKAMERTEKDDVFRGRYQEEIIVFEHAIEIQRSVDKYMKQYGKPPETLDMLVPEFLPHLMSDNEYFDLVYTPPLIRLERPENKPKKGIPWR